MRGGLPVDAITDSYDKYGNPVKEEGNNVYASGATWTPYNEISQINLGTGPSTATLTYNYDPQTSNVTSINLSDQQPVPQVDNIAYTYNADQQITQIADTQGATGSAPVQDQCFTYDSLSRLNEAWTSSNACATNPATAGNGTVKGPEPYWQSWTFDSIGDIVTQISHAPAQMAEPKAPLWEVLLAPFVATAVGVGGVMTAGPAADAAYAPSVRVSAWWLTLGAGGGAAGTAAMSGSGGYAGTTARTEVAETGFNWGGTEFAKTDATNFRLSEIIDASDNVNQLADNSRAAFSTTQYVGAAGQPVASGYVNDPILAIISATVATGTALSETGVPQTVMAYMDQAPWLALWRGW